MKPRAMPHNRPPQTGIDQTRKHFRVTLDDAPAQLLGTASGDVVESLVDDVTIAWAADALGAIEESDVPVVLSDQRMPGLSGVEFLRRVARVRPDTTRLLVTGYSDIKTVIDAINEALAPAYPELTTGAPSTVHTVTAHGKVPGSDERMWSMLDVSIGQQNVICALSFGMRKPLMHGP